MHFGSVRWLSKVKMYLNDNNKMIGIYYVIVIFYMNNFVELRGRLYLLLQKYYEFEEKKNSTIYYNNIVVNTTAID